MLSDFGQSAVELGGDGHGQGIIAYSCILGVDALQYPTCPAVCTALLLLIVLVMDLALAMRFGGMVENLRAK